MKVAICEDNPGEREALRERIAAALKSRGVKAELFAYETGEALLAACKTHYFSMLFLDILLPGVSGVEVALKLRRQGSEAPIVFVTVTQDYLADSYRVWAVHYLVKPVEQAPVEEALGRALKVLAKEEETLEISVDRHREHIPYSNILYIRAEARICGIHTANGVYRPYANLQDIAAALCGDSRFLHCHRSYIINLDHVLAMQKDRVAMPGDVLVPIRRGETVRVREAYQNRRFEVVSGRD